MIKYDITLLLGDIELKNLIVSLILYRKCISVINYNL